MDAAAELFVEHGYQGTAMSDIARHAGMSVGTLYNRFPSKSDLFLEVFRSYGRRQGERVRDAIASARSAGVADDVDLFVAGTHAYLVGAFREAALGRLFHTIGTAEIDVSSIRSGQEIWLERNARQLGLVLGTPRADAIAAAITGALGGWVRGVQLCDDDVDALAYIAEVVAVERKMLRAVMG
ncbi:helix-turn-helix domain-containing protein [Microbacterium sp. zg-Y818]|uniref:TetR/AcrR family transcriptional regulator n=1 Tax=unclassified Microbacterium TaxID=2609290 RepID=UPI00214B15E2|nr:MULTISPECIES: TetR/AcrR family transcriptional regulator [unclassified Microbacterium]MCR2799335.1 TetR/AcrR family transcriptional regulator [Microbacterium sp. zg.Y818]WIM23922.1 helix-turn-helix domain-containing protein [Microbacterium sp. zg-Y818]